MPTVDFARDLLCCDYVLCVPDPIEYENERFKG